MLCQKMASGKYRSALFLLEFFDLIAVLLGYPMIAETPPAQNFLTG